ncbi:hypothetical protein [Yersinia intermedia]|uniref:hypothetical protein n=1 Tax=Yersinia intermedia TaxID=631 RepID=UPI0012DD07F1|nr:hypothetical protein [Yersinia intermedia]MCW8113966.1 hypothetical protein [Yersinia intermedia]MDA5518802.1 hypothetical protein [Yersinia intermedia]
MLNKSLWIVAVIAVLYFGNAGITWLKGLVSGEVKLCPDPESKDLGKFVDCSSIEPKG